MKEAAKSDTGLNRWKRISVEINSGAKDLSL